jgi:hypothetical protein
LSFFPNQPLEFPRAYFSTQLESILYKPTVSRPPIETMRNGNTSRDNSLHLGICAKEIPCIHDSESKPYHDNIPFSDHFFLKHTTTLSVDRIKVNWQPNPGCSPFRKANLLCNECHSWITNRPVIVLEWHVAFSNPFEQARDL